MNAEWMVASTIVAGLLFVLASGLQRVAALYGNLAARWIWIAAISGATALPIGWLASAPGSTPASVVLGPHDVSDVAFTAASAPIPRGHPVSSWFSGIDGWRLEIPPIPQRADRPLLLVSWGGSAVLLLVLLATAVQLGRQRRRWQARSVAGQSVLVSLDFGPAVVGVLRPQIVVPAWLLHLDEGEQQLILRHEAEHLAAHDPVLLLSTLGLLILAPWNLGLRMQWRGLRRAIEIDCDARVIRHGVERTDYAKALLRASEYGHGDRLVSIAFAEPATALSARIEHLMRPAPRRRAMKTTLGVLAAVAIVALISAMRAPRQGEALPTSSIVPDTVRAERRADPATSREEMNDRIFRQLFAGISLNPEREQRARELIAAEQVAQAGLRGPVLAIWPKRIAFGEARDARLRELVAGGDRVTLNARLAERAYRPITAEDVVRGLFASYLSGMTLSAKDRGKAEHLIRTYVANDLAAYDRAGYDVMAANYREVLEQDLRTYVRSPEDLVRYDQRLAAMHARGRTARAIVHLTSVGLETPTAAGDSLSAPLLVYATGRARVGIGRDVPVELTETLWLYRLPTITADVTEGEVHLELAGEGKIQVRGDVTGGPATHVTATGRHIVLLKGGVGIRSGP